MKRKIISIVLALTVLFAVSACGSEQENVGVKELQECTVQILLPGAEKPADFGNVLNAINDKLEEDGKPYTVEITFYDDTKYHEDLPLKVSDGYDLAHVNVQYFSDYIKTNTLLDATPYLKAYGKEIVDNTEAYAKTASSYNGKQYLIPRNMPVSTNVFVEARKDWMTEFGLTKITTIEELDTYFARTGAKIGDPSKNKYVYCADNNYEFLLREYCPSYYFPVKEWASMPVYIDISDEGKVNGKYVVRNYYESDAYVGLITKTREYYNLQYVSPEQISGSYNYFLANQLGLVWSTLLKQSERIDTFKAALPEAELYDVYLNSDAPKYIFDGIDNTMALLSSCKNPNEAVDFLNWIRSSQENHDLVCYGVKGVNYNLTEDGRLDFTGISLNKRYSAEMPYWAFNDIRFARWSKFLSDEYIETVSTWNDESAGAKVSPFVGYMIDTGNTELASIIQNVNAVASLATDLTNGRIEPSGLAASGKTNYQDLLDKLKTAGIDRLIEILQADIDNYLGQ